MIKLLSVIGGKLVVEENGVVLREVKSLEDLNEVCRENGGSICCSSTVDFPEESTDDQAVIDLCHQIRD